MSGPTCGAETEMVAIGWMRTCHEPAIVNVDGKWRCPAHANLAPGWRLVREDEYRELEEDAV